MKTKMPTKTRKNHALGEDVCLTTWMQAPGVHTTLILEHAVCGGDFLFKRRGTNKVDGATNQLWACDLCGAEVLIHAESSMIGLRGFE